MLYETPVPLKAPVVHIELHTDRTYFKLLNRPPSGSPGLLQIIGRNAGKLPFVPGLSPRAGIRPFFPVTPVTIITGIRSPNCPTRGTCHSALILQSRAPKPRSDKPAIQEESETKRRKLRKCLKRPVLCFRGIRNKTKQKKFNRPCPALLYFVCV